MKLALPLLILLFFTSLVHAQPQHFIFLQTEGDQPFFVKQSERTLPSGSSGFVLLSGLADSSQLIRIGFPDNRFPEQQFRVPFNGNDRGFVARQTPTQTWVLQDLQSNESIAAESTPGQFRIETKKVSRFTEVLAKASGDPTLLYDLIRITPEVPVGEAIVQNGPDKTDTLTAAPGIDSTGLTRLMQDTAAVIPGGTVPVAMIGTADTIQSPVRDSLPSVAVLPESEQDKTNLFKSEPELQDTVKGVFPGDTSAQATIRTETYTPSRITRRSESSTTAGFGLTFTDEQGSTIDTIRILIPRDSGSVRLMSAMEEPVSMKPERRPVTCEQVADQAAIIKLRRRMEKAPDEEGMLKESGRFIRSNCLLTAQVRELGTLFPTEAGRVGLYAQVYPKIADASRFVELATGLEDEVSREKFRSIMH